MTPVFKHLGAATLALAFAGSLPLHAQDAAAARRTRPASTTETGGEPRSNSDAPEMKEGTLPIPLESKVETRHDWTAGGRAVHYTATAGNLLVKDDADKAIGSLFYVAYTEDGAPGIAP